MDTQEWLSSNVRRRFPFAEASADATGIDLDFLSEWLLDLRIFTSPHEEIDCWISKIEFNAVGTLTLEGIDLSLDDVELTYRSLVDSTWADLVLLGSNLTVDQYYLALGNSPNAVVLPLTLAGDELTLDDEELTMFTTGGEYRITVSSAEGVVMLIEAPIQKITGTPDTGKTRYAYDGPKVAMFVPGPNWEAPTLLGLDTSNSRDFTTPDEIESTRIHPTNVNTGIRSFKGFYLTAPYYDSDGVLVETDEVLPAYGEAPEFTANVLQAGYNIQLGQAGDFLDLNLVPGAGDGLYPCPEVECRPKLRFLNRVGPNDQGNVTLEFFDCLRHSGLTDIDPETELPYTNGIKVYSDCMPCCTCEDYSNVGLSISRMSAKFKDINEDINGVLQRSQYYYDEAVDLINARSPGLALVYRIEILPDQICLHIFNNSNVPIYAALSTQFNRQVPVIDPPFDTLTLGGEELTLGDEELILGEGDEGATECGSSGIFIEPDQLNIREGIVTTKPPLSGLVSSEQNTGIINVEDVEEWRDLDCGVTVGYGDDFDPIPPAAIAKVCYFSPYARGRMGFFESLCANLQIVLGGPQGQAVLDNDSQYQLLLDQFNALSIIGVSCLDDTEFPAGAAGDADRYGCQVQAAADGLQRQEIRDQLLARKYELGFALPLCGATVMTPEMEQLIVDLRALSGLVGPSCKDGSYACVDASCTAEFYSDTCQSQVRNQNVERSEVYLRLEKVLRDQMTALNECLRTELGLGLIVDLISSVETSVAGVYGDYNFACRAGNATFDIDRPDHSTDYDCIEELLNIVAIATQTS